MSVRDDDLKVRYEQDGVAVVRGVLGQSDLEAIRCAVNRFLADPRFLCKDQTCRDDPGRFIVGAFLWRWDETVRRIALDSPLPQLAARALGTADIRFFYDQLFYKKAGTRTWTQWHQDLPFWPFLGDQIPSLWLALSPTNRDSSAVIYCPRSHKAGSVLAPADAFDDEALFETESLPELRGVTARQHHRENLVSFDLAPGDVVVHHPLVIHGAGENRSAADRIGLSFRYLGPKVRWWPRMDAMFVPGAAGRLIPGEAPAVDDLFPRVTLMP